LNKLSKLFFIKIFFLLFALSFTAKVFGAASISVTSVGSQQIIGNTTVQAINADINKQTTWVLYVLPLTNGLINTADPTKVIPLNRLVLSNSQGTPFQLQFGNLTQIASGSNFGRDNIPFNFVLQNLATDYPGDYSGNFTFRLVAGAETVSTTYTLLINRPPVQTITLTPAQLNIAVNTSGLLQPNYTQETATPEIITLNSTIPWKLVLKGNTATNGISYFFKVLSIPPGATTSYSGAYFPYTTSDTNIVTGTSSVVNGTVQVNYQIKINQSGFQPAGTYNITVPYNITP